MIMQQNSSENKNQKKYQNQEGMLRIVLDEIHIEKIDFNLTKAQITFDLRTARQILQPAIISLYTQNGQHIIPLKYAKEYLFNRNIVLSENMDPYIVMAIDQVMDDLYEQVGHHTLENSSNALENIKIKRFSQYKDSIETMEPLIEKEYINIVYSKENVSDKVHNILNGKLEKSVMPYIRMAQNSIFVKIDDTIDTRTTLEKIQDKLKK